MQDEIRPIEYTNLSLRLNSHTMRRLAEVAIENGESLEDAIVRLIWTAERSVKSKKSA
jgi:macrodomain Ter protein organizer (MatP/YcbG family)